MASRLPRTLFLGIAAIALAAAPSHSQGKGHGKGHEKHGDDDEGAGKYAFSARDREVVVGYFSNHASNLPPGLANRGGNLPPGLEKQLQRNGTLPPALQKSVQPWTAELERQLPPLPAEYRRGVIGAHIVIFNRHTNVTVDVMKDVARCV